MQTVSQVFDLLLVIVLFYYSELPASVLSEAVFWNLKVAMEPLDKMMQL